ncbi:MAG: hypothetical protein IT310_08795 [Anaerolineales bacterium]|nr:hypothetical protein [Anaerolineales bacterium]
MQRRSTRIIGLCIIVALTLACAPTLGATPAPLPTYDPNSINTIIAGTANAASTQTALFVTPSATPTLTPTFTPTLTETPTTVPTIQIVMTTAVIPTQIPQVNGTNDKFGCSVLSSSPRNGFGFSPGIEFTVSWTLANTGREEWDSASADIRYISGDKLYVKSAYDLEKNVAPNEQYTVTVKMKAPMESGSYTTVWALRTNAAEYCRMSITIVV